MKRGFLLAAGLPAALLLAACSRSPIEKAVAGGLLSIEENLVVTDHCQGCHIHAKFTAETHLEKVRARYAQDHPFRQASRCLQCHRLSLENVFRREARGTDFPHGALVNVTDIPKPSDQPGAAAKKDAAAKPEEKKKERKWYFFYLF